MLKQGQYTLDNDRAGKTNMCKHVVRSKADGFKAVAAYIPSKLSGTGKVDWNDAFKQSLLDEKFFQNCRWHGDLMLADSAHKKAMMIHEHFDSSFFCFEFNKRTYGFEINQKVLNASIEDDDSYETALRKASKIIEIANFSMQFNYFKCNELTEESWYSATLSFPHKGASKRCDFTSAQIAATPEFKKRALNTAPGAVFTGKPAHLDWLCRQHLYNIKTVETVDFIGYSKKHGTYILDQKAFKDGREFTLNKEDYFEIGDTSLVSLFKGIQLNIAEAADYNPIWVNHIWDAWGEKGIIALTFWLGTLFAEQIRDKSESFPFIELVGDAGTGKSTLVEFLWRLYGRADALNRLQISDVSFFLTKCLQKEKSILDQYTNAFKTYEELLLETAEIKTPRVAKTHAQIFALADALFEVINLDKEKRMLVREQIKAMAIECQHAIGGDHPIVQNFWEVAEYLQTHSEYGINYSRKAGIVAISLNEFVEAASHHRQEIPTLEQLKKHLKSGSKTRPLINISHGVSSRLMAQKTIRCWTFNDLPHAPFKDGGAIGHPIEAAK